MIAPLSDRIEAFIAHPTHYSASETVELVEEMRRELPSQQMLIDIAYLAGLARGSSWPGSMADAVERRAERVCRWTSEAPGGAS